MVRMLPGQVAALDAWIAAQAGPKMSRPEAIRRLVDLGQTLPKRPFDGDGAEPQEWPGLLDPQEPEVPDLTALMHALLPVSKQGRRPSNAVAPPDLSTENSQFRIKLSADSLRFLAAEAQFPLRIIDEKELTAEAKCLSTTLEVALLWLRENSPPLLKKDVVEWQAALTRWIAEGTTLLGGRLESRSATRALSVGPTAAVATLLSNSWPVETRAEGKQLPHAQRRLALLDDLKKAGALTSFAEELSTTLSSTELGETDDQEPSGPSEYSVTQALLAIALPTLSALQILATEMEARTHSLQRRTRKIDRWGLLRRLSYHYEHQFGRPYSTSRIFQDAKNAGEPTGPAIRWTRALFKVAAEECRPRGKIIPELKDLIDWSSKPYWGPEVILPVEEWERARSQR
ncbi:hypothetical protein [Teichococcus oryzae]|nr:hypothetical protein [Pseudoroseomonas oryzae]